MGKEGGGGGEGCETHFPADMFSKSHFPVVKSHSHKQNSEKNPSVIHTSYFLRKTMASKYDQQDPKMQEDLRRCAEEDRNLLDYIVGKLSRLLRYKSSYHFTFLSFLPAGKSVFQLVSVFILSSLVERIMLGVVSKRSTST